MPLGNKGVLTGCHLTPIAAINIISVLIKTEWDKATPPY